uniref:BUD13 homolog n=1 Tax=Setaria digitata TaxID=48799 RepID=A0A915Q5A8_9BILA
MRLITLLGSLFDDYRKTTPRKLKIIDSYMFYVLITGIIQFVYCVLVGTFPFNSFLSGFVSTVGCFVLAASLRIQVNPENKPLFPHIAPERAFADFIFAHVIFHLNTLMDDAAKKAREEYLKKYLSKDDKQAVKKQKKKKKKIGIGLKIHENDAFVAVAPCAEQTSSDDEKDVEVTEKVKKLRAMSKFKPAAFEAVEIEVETTAIRKRHDSSSDENVTPEELSLPTTSGRSRKTSLVRNEDHIVQKTLGQSGVDSNIFLPSQRVKDEAVDSDSSPPRMPKNSTRRSPSSYETSSRHGKVINNFDMGVASSRCRIKDEPLDSDASPPRRPTSGVRRNADGDISDISPPRRSKPTNNSDSDLSPPRNHVDRDKIYSCEEDSQHHEHHKRGKSGSVESCRRKKIGWNSEASRHNVERTKEKHRGRSRDEGSRVHHLHYEEHRGRKSSKREMSHHGKSDRSNEDGIKSSGGSASAGLKTLERHREEMKRLQEDEAELLRNWEGFASGKDAAATHRKKLTGKGRESKEDRERKEREAKKQKELEEKYKNWNKGLRQIEERSQKLNEMARVAQEDFARHADDETMNEHLKKQLYEKDPMYNYVKKKKENAEIRSGTAYPKYKGSWPPNRFNIPPGHRWDGVNRSNGFEDRIAETTNRKLAQRTEYYENIAKYEV